MKSGILYGNAAALDGIIDRIEEELGQKVTVIATGGMSSKKLFHIVKRKMIPGWRSASEGYRSLR